MCNDANAALPLYDALHGPTGGGRALIVVTLLQRALELIDVTHQEDAFALVHTHWLTDPDVSR